MYIKCLHIQLFIYTLYKALQQPAKVEVRRRDTTQGLSATVLYKILSVSFHCRYNTWEHFKPNSSLSLLKHVNLPDVMGALRVRNAHLNPLIFYFI